MKLLLDTHIWVWYLLDDSRLSTTLAQAIADEKNELWLSPISLWETHLLAEKGRLILEPSPEQWIADSLQKLDTKEATLSNEIAILSRQLISSRSSRSLYCGNSSSLWIYSCYC